MNTMIHREKISEKTLPAKEKLFSELNNAEISVSAYSHTQRVRNSLL